MDATFIRNLPKAELHLHLEGSLEPELMFALARRNGISLPFANVEAVRTAYNFSNLQDFLDIYYRSAQVLRTEEDFYDLTTAYLARAKADGVVHVEPFFDPQTHTGRGLPFPVAADGILKALTDGEAKFGITSKPILCFLRHLDEEAAFAVLKEAEPYAGRIAGVGLDSSEKGNPPENFARVFAAARAMGLKLVAHAGEEGPAEYVRQAFDVLKVDRIDHGNHVLDDMVLTARLAKAHIGLTVCPLSNLKLGVVKTLKRHPLKRMLNLGLRVSVNSDDPAYFGGYIGDNYIAAAEALALSQSEIVQIARNSFLGAFLSGAEKSRHLEALDAFAHA